MQSEKFWWCIGFASVLPLAACESSSSANGGDESESEAEAEAEAEAEGEGEIIRKLMRKPGQSLIVDQIEELMFADIDVVQFGLNGYIENGDFLAGFELLELDDKTATNDDDVKAAFTVLGDLDGDPDNNFSGKEGLCIDPSTLDEDDNPTTVLNLSLTDGLLTGSSSVVYIPPITFGPITIPALPVRNVTFSGTLVSGEVKGGVVGLNDATLSGYLWAVDLADANVAGANVLQVLSCGFVSIEPTPLSIDIDGDGLEQVICDGSTISSCPDYDDVEPDDTDPVSIKGPSCGAELEDGYDFTMSFSAVRFIIKGVCVSL